MSTAARLLTTEGVPSATWQDLHPAGRILIGTIAAAIDDAEVVIAEVSSMNRNVLFEAGYALAKSKRLLLAIDESLESARRLWDGVQLFKTIGRLDYHGNGDHLKHLIQSSLPEGNADDLLVALLSESRPQQSNAVFAPTVPVRFQAADMLDKELNNRGSIQVLASGDDLGLAPLSYYASEIFRSSAAIFHFMNPERTRATEHNARSSFLAGFAHGWGRPILMLAEAGFESPLDYKDLLFNYETAAQMVRHVDDWLASLPLRPGSTRRLGRLTVKLKLPVTSFGQYVAENEDSRLDDYFLPTQEFNMLIHGEATVFVGRKGTGKTATMLQAASDLSKDRRNLVVKVKPTSYELAGLVELVSRFDLHSGSEYLLNNLWNFLLSTEVAIQLLASREDHPAGLGGSNELRTLADRLALMKVDRSIDLATRLEDAIAEILAKAAGASDDRELRDIVSSSLRVQWLKELHREIRDAADAHYERIAILVDNLDKAWERGTDFEATSRFLLALLSASGQVRKNLTRGANNLDLTLEIGRAHV